MIRHLCGTVTQTHPTYIVLDVGGVGYRIFTNINTAYEPEEKICIHTHLAVRENAMDLYGFATQEALSFFELLLTLPKVGPKTAMQILSQADIALLQNTILSQDAAHLSKMSGLSKKTAEKIVLGLKDTFDTVAYTLQQDNTHSSSNTSDAIDALITLGYPQSDARKVVQQILTEKPQYTNTNDIIKAALQYLH
jgi:holliday junction DNA helicase RuvA